MESIHSPTRSNMSSAKTRPKIHERNILWQSRIPKSSIVDNEEMFYFDPVDNNKTNASWHLWIHSPSLDLQSSI